MKNISEQEFNEKLGRYLRRERQKKHISQRVLAEKMGVTKASISFWENGKRQMYASTLLDYCDAIGIDANVIVEQFQ